MSDQNIQKFKNYLKSDGLKNGTIDSYVQYIKISCETFIDKNEVPNAFDYLLKVQKEQTKIALKFLKWKIAEELKTGNPKLKPKTLKNYKSGILKLELYIDSYYRGKQRYGDIFKVLEKYPMTEEYTSKELKGVFKSRLNTQDRYYTQTSFPIRAINRILSNDSNYKKAIDDLIDNIVFLVDDSNGKKQKRTKDINKIVIEKDNTYFIDKRGIKHILYTEIWKKGKCNGGNFEPIKAKDISDLSLDHNNALNTLLSPIKIKQYPELEKISADALNIMLNNKIEKYQIYSELEKNNKIQNYNPVLLSKDICSIYKNIGLTIMKKSYNSSKNST